MRRFNQIVVVVGLVILFVFLPIVAAIPDRISQIVQEGAFSFDAFLAPTSGRLIVAAVSIVLWIVTVLLLWLELRPRATREITVSAVEGGEARVSSDSVARRLERRVATISEIHQAEATVVQGKEGVLANLVLHTGPSVNLPTVTSAAINLVREVLENEVGARVAKVNVSVRHEAPPTAVPEMPPPRPAPEQPVTPVAPVTPPEPPQPAEVTALEEEAREIPPPAPTELVQEVEPEERVIWAPPPEPEEAEPPEPPIEAEEEPDAEDEGEQQGGTAE